MTKAKLFTAQGDRFGRLLVSGEIYRVGKHRVVFCKCDCGADKVAPVSHLFSGATVSCGCKRTENAKKAGANNTKHGQSTPGSKSPAYLSWSSMLARCNNPNATGYRNYGGRGISVCPQWQGENGFSTFLADLGERPHGRTLDRVDNDGDYTPDNCQWADIAEQKRNRRNAATLTYDGRTLTAAEWARELGTHRNNILRRMKRGQTPEQILRPIGKCG